jgi:UDP-N-acetylmuramate-alanine ligase
MEDIRKQGVPALYEDEVDSLLAKVVPDLKSGDVVAAFSNGSFDGLLTKLIKKLEG